MTACPVVRIKPSHPSQGAFVEINASDFDPAKHEKHDDPVAAPLPPLPPPPAPPVDPLANLAQDWRDMNFGKLRELAEKVAGRTPEDKAQAVQLIEQALADRAAG